MSTVTEGAIHSDIAGLGREHFENLGNHDGPVHACGCFARRKNLGDGLGETLRVMLLVFLAETARVRAAIAHPALVWRWI